MPWGGSRGSREEEEEEEGDSPGLTSHQHNSFSPRALLVPPAPTLANLLCKL